MSAALFIFTGLALALAYAFQQFTKRVSPNIPFAGSQTGADPTFSERLRAPQEYAKDPVAFLCKTRELLGDVFCVDLLVVKLVFFLGPEGNKELFRASEDRLSFEEAVKWSLGPVVKPLYSTPGFSPTTNRLLKVALIKQEKLDAYFMMCGRVTDTFFAKWEAQDTIPLFKSISHLVIANLLLILAGEDIYNRHGAELIPRMAQFERDLQKPILRVTPWALWKFTAPGKALFATCARFDEIVTRDMNDILANPDKHAGRSDYLYFLVSQLGNQYAQCYGRHIMSLVFGGHANAAMTVPWLFLHARRVPGALDKIREEATLPRGERKPYLEACLRETGRLYTNTTTMRMAKETTHVAGHLIPARTLVACSPLATQRVDPAHNGIFENAGTWDPMRFLNTAGGDASEKSDGATSSAFARWFQRAEFVQFGMGQHACPGEKMARLFIFDLVLKTWMENYDVVVVSGLQEGSKGIDGVGAEGAWTEENFGTPSVRGEDVMVSVRKCR